MPVLVKDGKPCSGNGSAHAHSLPPASNPASNIIQPLNNNNNNIANNSNHVPPSVGLNLISSDTQNSQSPDTPSSLLTAYSGSAATDHNPQMLQHCNSSLSMSNSLAMAYRNQNNFIANGHQQQQCTTAYLPLQGRAW